MKATAHIACLAALGPGLIVFMIARPARARPASQFADQGLVSRGLKHLASSPLRPDSLAVASPSEVFYRQRGGRPWRRLWRYRPTTDGAGISSLAIGGPFVFVGTPRGLWRLTVSGAAQGSRAVTLGAGAVTALTAGPRGRRLWAAQGRWVWSRGPGGQWRRRGQSPGGSWRRLVAHPRRANLLAGTDGRRAWYSTDGGQQWRAPTGGSLIDQVIDLAFDAAGSTGLLVLTGRQLLQVRAAGPGWRRSIPNRARRLLGPGQPTDRGWLLGSELWQLARGRPMTRVRNAPAVNWRDLARDWRRPGGLWALSSRAVWRLVPGVSRRAPRRACDLSVPLPGPTAGAGPHRRRWWPRISLRFYHRLREALRLSGREARHWQVQPRQQWGIMLQLSWPLPGPPVVAGERQLAEATHRRRQRWLALARSHCERSRGSQLPTDPRWVASQSAAALLRFQHRQKE